MAATPSTGAADIPAHAAAWLRAAIVAPVMAAVFGLFWLRDMTALSDTAGRTPIPAAIISAQRIATGKAVVTRVTVDYRPFKGGAVSCRVNMDLDGFDRTLLPGRTLMVLPRKVACYEPVLVGSIGDPRWPAAGLLASVAAFGVAVWGSRRAVRNMQEGR